MCAFIVAWNIFGMLKGVYAASTHSSANTAGYAVTSVPLHAKCYNLVNICVFFILIALYSPLHSQHNSVNIFPSCHTFYAFFSWMPHWKVARLFTLLYFLIFVFVLSTHTKCRSMSAHSTTLQHSIWVQWCGSVILANFMWGWMHLWTYSLKYFILFEWCILMR